VDMMQAERWIPDHMADLEYIKFNGGPVSFGWLSNDFGPVGVIGDATGATAEHGRVIFDRAVVNGVASLAEIARFRHEP
jgi:creatinine amidohydrolase